MVVKGRLPIRRFSSFRSDESCSSVVIEAVSPVREASAVRAADTRTKADADASVKRVPSTAGDASVSPAGALSAEPSDFHIAVKGKRPVAEALLSPA